MRKRGYEGDEAGEGETEEEPTCVVLLLWHELLHVLYHPAHILRVLGDGTQFLLSEVRCDLLAQQDLADHVAEVRRARSVLCNMRRC